MRHDLHIRQGETWQHVYTHNSGGSPVDLTGYTARMSMKTRVGGALEAYLSTGSDANGGVITLGGANGTVTIDMTAAQTAALLGDPAAPIFGVGGNPIAILVFDLELVNGGVTRAMEGRIILHREVTT